MMTGQQMNAAIALIAGVQANYDHDYMALLSVIHRQGFEITETSSTRESGWSVEITKSGLAMVANGETLTRAACLAFLRLNDVLIRNQVLIDSGEVRFRPDSASLAVAQHWLADGCKVAREEWGEGIHLRLNRGKCRSSLKGPAMYGVPVHLFDREPDITVTRMPQLVIVDIDKLTTADWTPTASDILACDWKLI